MSGTFQPSRFADNALMTILLWLVPGWDRCNLVPGCREACSSQALGEQSRDVFRSKHSDAPRT